MVIQATPSHTAPSLGWPKCRINHAVCSKIGAGPVSGVWFNADGVSGTRVGVSEKTFGGAEGTDGVPVGKELVSVSVSGVPEGAIGVTGNVSETSLKASGV